MPLTAQGFQRKTYDDILTEQSARARLLFGDDIDVSENSVFGKILRLYCLDASDNQEIAEGVYLSAFPNTAKGVSLDRLCPLAGISRNPATYARHNITITGTAGTPVSMGFLVSDGDVVFHTVSNYVIGSNGTVAAVVECNESGTIGNVQSGTITTIVNPIAGVSSISHTSVGVAAIDTETDYSLRQRFSKAFVGTGSGTVDSIRGAILRISGVESVLIKENSTNSTDSDGLPAHSFQCIVTAASTVTNQQIAEAIFSKKPLGISTHGSTTVSVTDAGGTAHSVKFSHTSEVSVYVRCTIQTNSGYTSDSEALIKQNIVNKINSLENGDNVTATSLYGAIYVDGVSDVTSLTISSNGTTYGTTAISISESQVARTATNKIEVTVSS